MTAKSSLKLAQLGFGLFLYLGTSLNVAASDSVSKEVCAQALQNVLQNLTKSQLGGADLLQFIENAFVVKAEAGRIGFKSSEAPILMGRKNLLQVVKLIEQKKLPVEDIRQSYLDLAKNHPNATPDEWVQALIVAVQAEIDPKILSAELSTLSSEIRFRPSVKLSFSETQNKGALKFDQLFEFWILSKQLSKKPEYMAMIVNEIDSLFPGLEMADLLEIALWSHMSDTPVSELRKIVSDIQSRFLVTTRKTFGFRSSSAPLLLSVEQAVVIHKASVVSDKSLDELLVEFNSVVQKNQIQEVEEIIEPLRESVEQALKQEVKE